MDLTTQENERNWSIHGESLLSLSIQFFKDIKRQRCLNLKNKEIPQPELIENDPNLDFLHLKYNMDSLEFSSVLEEENFSEKELEDENFSNDISSFNIQIPTNREEENIDDYIFKDTKLEVFDNKEIRALAVEMEETDKAKNFQEELSNIIVHTKTKSCTDLKLVENMTNFLILESLRYFGSSPPNDSIISCERIPSLDFSALMRYSPCGPANKGYGSPKEKDEETTSESESFSNETDKENEVAKKEEKTLFIPQKDLTKGLRVSLEKTSKVFARILVELYSALEKVGFKYTMLPEENYHTLLGKYTPENYITLKRTPDLPPPIIKKEITPLSLSEDCMDDLFPYNSTPVYGISSISSTKYNQYPYSGRNYVESVGISESKPLAVHGQTSSYYPMVSYHPSVPPREPLSSRMSAYQQHTSGGSYIYHPPFTPMVAPYPMPKAPAERTLQPSRSMPNISTAQEEIHLPQNANYQGQIEAKEQPQPNEASDNSLKNSATMLMSFLEQQKAGLNFTLRGKGKEIANMALGNAQMRQTLKVANKQAAAKIGELHKEGFDAKSASLKAKSEEFKRRIGFENRNGNGLAPKQVDGIAQKRDSTSITNRSDINGKAKVFHMENGSALQGQKSFPNLATDSNQRPVYNQAYSQSRVSSSNFRVGQARAYPPASYAPSYSRPVVHRPLASPPVYNIRNSVPRAFGGPRNVQNASSNHKIVHKVVAAPVQNRLVSYPFHNNPNFSRRHANYSEKEKFNIPPPPPPRMTPVRQTWSSKA